MRTIKHIHTAEYSPISDLETYRAIPTRTVQYIDPFLFLNHHGPQVYPPNNNGLPFGPHPHRGMETVTFILNGDISHKDSSGHESIINAGGVQWMTAGKGLIHAEVSSDEFKEKGGPLEILQLWLNLPAKLKMTKPFYKGLQKEDIPSVAMDNGKVKLNLVSGKWESEEGAFNSAVDVHLSTAHFEKDGFYSIDIPKEQNIFFYVINGNVVVNGTDVEALKLVEFNNDGEKLEIKAKTESIVLLGFAKPLDEPVVAQGPFVMNTEKEIEDAYKDYRQGKFGTWSS
ncbi:pirin family protein [Cytophagaceae bacterium ABcell3]|nr:pirin family protein [Cytophagaceae bacterium ABcell3]